MDDIKPITNSHPTKLNRLLPNTFVIGSEKSGTTRLCYLMAHHNQIFVPSMKETQFFTSPNPSPSFVKWFSNLYQHSPHCPIRVEGGVWHSKRHLYDGVARRISALNPDAKIIYLVRDPIARIESAWIEFRDQGTRVLPDFNESVYKCSDLTQTSRYWWQIAPYYDYFPKEQVLVLLSESFHRQEQKTLDQVFAFLGIEKYKQFLNAQPLTATSTHEANRLQYDEGKNTRDSKRIPLAMADWLRSKPRTLGKVRKFTPDSFRKHSRRLLSRRVQHSDTTWSKQAKAYAFDVIAEDAVAMLDHMNASVDVWPKFKEHLNTCGK